MVRASDRRPARGVKACMVSLPGKLCEPCDSLATAAPLAWRELEGSDVAVGIPRRMTLVHGHRAVRRRVVRGTLPLNSERRARPTVVAQRAQLGIRNQDFRGV